jgi:hypothetical protein
MVAKTIRMWLQQLPHWQHLHAVATASPGAGRLVCRYAHYPVVLVARVKYLPENHPKHTGNRTDPLLPGTPDPIIPRPP